MIDEMIKHFYETATEESREAIETAFEIFEGVNYDKPFEVLEELGVLNEYNISNHEFMEIIKEHILGVCKEFGIKFSEDVGDIHPIIHRLDLLLNKVEVDIEDHDDLELVYGMELANLLGTGPLSEARMLEDIEGFHKIKMENKSYFETGVVDMSFINNFVRFTQVAAFKIADWMYPVKQYETFSLDLFNSLCEFDDMGSRDIASSILLMSISDKNYRNVSPEERISILDIFRYQIPAKLVNEVAKIYVELVHKFHKVKGA